MAYVAGDLSFPTDFQTNVLMPFSQKGSHNRISAAIDAYEENFRPPGDARDRTDSKMDPDFEKAWNEEIGFSLSDLRIFMDAIEDIGFERKQAIIRLKKSELIPLLAPDFDGDQVESLLNALTLKHLP